MDVRGISAVSAILGSNQKGVVKHAQLVAAGLDGKTISRAVKAGALHRQHRGVYVVGHLAMAPFAAEQAALLACGPRSLLSHGSAAYAWGLLEEPPPEVHVTIVGNRCRPKAGIRIRRVVHLPKPDVRTRHGLAITSPARTLIDLASQTSLEKLERLVAEGRVRRLIRPGELEKALERNARRCGTRRLRALLETEGSPGLTRSQAERIMRRLVREARLAQPQTNRRVGVLGSEVEVDFLWPAQKLAVEIDSWQFHGHRRAFENDRKKTLALQAAGYEVIRISARQLTDEPLAVIAQIARSLDRLTRTRG